MKYSKPFLVKNILISIIIFIVINGIAETFIYINNQEEEQKIINNLHLNGDLVSQEIQKNISSGIFATETLHTLLKSSNYSTENFDTWAKQMTSVPNSPNNLQLAPDGIVQHIYPLTGNEGAIGHNLFQDQNRNLGAIKTVDSKQLTFVGPIKLIQSGELAVIARKPIFIDETDEFWGFTTAVILVKELLQSSKEIFNKNGINFSLEGDNPDSNINPIFIRSENYNEPSMVTLEITVPNGRWFLKMTHPPVVYDYYIVIKFISLVLAILVTLFYIYFQTRIYNRNLEIKKLNNELYNLSMEDVLTGVGNRRAGTMCLENFISQVNRYEYKLSIILADLDHFKLVNDTYGHQIGDEFLIHFTKILKSIIRSSDKIVRLGGDEFLIILTGSNIQNAVNVAEKILFSTNSNPLKIDNNEIDVKLSMGIAEYAKDMDIEKLLAIADEKLYISKKKGRNCYSY